ncbi:zf-HC2 domain-containing protein [Amycolatopsis ultiminotia]|uniref:Zf-HC2 domain-containing protein n=1 Tax=Amycolatopsis ultiminotia TaxID=543629 RepID=A0ABP6Y4B8_9PSEU
MSHVPDRLLAAYVAGRELPGDEGWAIEAHLEGCAQCRARLAGVTTTEESGFLDAVWAGLQPRLTAEPQPLRGRARAWLHGWATPVMVPWLGMVVLVAAIAVFLDQASAGGVSLVQLFAPVLPVFGVAAAWSRGLDPAYELTAGSPRAGLDLILRRTVAVLVPVVLVLLLAGWLSGSNIGLVLLPALAFSAGTLALGTFIGAGWAAGVLAGVWLSALVLPTVAFGGSVALLSASLPVWAAVFVLAAGLVVLRRGFFMRLAAHN